ncbi:hypothetical protein HPP92_019726 [Vanilla planifolia]|uniref:Uncharacterized protein n=1 Tax=Vanilla planifolia TaxID=51239 RepID=A0A835UL11_VANPL|nr:hypothetical protein HPP92_020160 [Vanilla planifolia]KAG0465562.1 hypothetical protein HPP92_019726 [Vanilla planifolia]
MVAIDAMKRIPRIKFPQRHPKSSSGSAASSSAEQKDMFKFGSPPAQPTSASAEETRSYRFRSDVPAPPAYSAIGGKASLLPKRTPLSKEEIDAILLGGSF